jgi:hypothetical protein
LRIDDVPVTNCITGFWSVCTHALAYLLFLAISLINSGALTSAEE